jgi:hypothetical protein
MSAVKLRPRWRLESKRALFFALIVLGVIIMPVAILKGGLMPWIALIGLACAAAAIVLSAYLRD